MSQFLAAAWLLQKGLSFGGIAFALMGVGIFGWNFVRLNAVAAQGDSSEIPSESWRGPGARNGLMLFAGGVAMALASMFLTALLDGRH